MGDSSASATLAQSEIDKRVATMFELEEPSIEYDLRNHYCHKRTFDQFWSHAKKFIEEDVGTAVDDRRHLTVVHVAKAISICDLREKVVDRCPLDIYLPPDEWIRLQFSPACLTSHPAVRYTGRLKVRHRVQQRQWRKQHEDSHYAACLFWYEREYAVLMRAYSTFVCIDDKHRVKIGEPDAPVASLKEVGRLLFIQQHDWKLQTMISRSLASNHPWCWYATYQKRCLARGSQAKWK